MVETGAPAFGHPSPHKGRTSTIALIFGFAGGPIAWTGQLLVSYGLTSYACYPGPVPRSSIPPGWNFLSPGLTVFSVITLVIALAAFAVAYRDYTRTRAEMQGEANDLLEIGHGRSRFIALCGLITAAAFAMIIVFDTLSLYLVPPCTR